MAQVPASGEVSLVDGRARGSWYVLELNHIADGSGVMHLGHYDDTYVREEGELAFRALAASTWCTAARWTPAP